MYFPNTKHVTLNYNIGKNNAKFTLKRVILRCLNELAAK